MIAIYHRYIVDFVHASISANCNVVDNVVSIEYAEILCCSRGDSDSDGTSSPSSEDDAEESSTSSPVRTKPNSSSGGRRSMLVTSDSEDESPERPNQHQGANKSDGTKAKQQQRSEVSDQLDLSLCSVGRMQSSKFTLQSNVCLISALHNVPVREGLPFRMSGNRSLSH